MKPRLSTPNIRILKPPTPSPTPKTTLSIQPRRNVRTNPIFTTNMLSSASPSASFSISSSIAPAPPPATGITVTKKEVRKKRPKVKRRTIPTGANSPNPNAPSQQGPLVPQDQQQQQQQQQNISMNYSQLDDYLDQAQKAKDDAEINVAYSALQTFIETTDKIDQISRQQYEQIFEILSKAIFHEINEPPLSVIYSDGQKTCSIPLTKDASYSHKICELLNNRTPQGAIDSFLNKSFVQKLVLMLRSPSPEEQDSLEKLIHSIFNKQLALRPAIIREIEFLLDGYREGYNNFFCVSPALRFLIAFFKASNDFSQKNITLFKSTIFALYTTHFVTCFSNQLATLCGIFHSANRSLTVWCIVFLIDHWPKTCSNKICLFLYMIGMILIGISEQIEDSLFNSILTKTSESIASPNFKVAISAIELVRNNQFLRIMGEYPEVSFPFIIPAIRKAALHWSPDVVSAAKTTMTLYYNLNPDYVKLLLNKAEQDELAEKEAKGKNEGNTPNCSNTPNNGAKDSNANGGANIESVGKEKSRSEFETGWQLVANSANCYDANIDINSLMKATLLEQSSSVTRVCSAV